MPASLRSDLFTSRRNGPFTSSESASTLSERSHSEMRQPSNANMRAHAQPMPLHQLLVSSINSCFAALSSSHTVFLAARYFSRLEESGFWGIFFYGRVTNQIINMLLNWQHADQSHCG